MRPQNKKNKVYKKIPRYWDDWKKKEIKQRNLRYSKNPKLWYRFWKFLNLKKIKYSYKQILNKSGTRKNILFKKKTRQYKHAWRLHLNKNNRRWKWKNIAKKNKKKNILSIYNLIKLNRWFMGPKVVSKKYLEPQILKNKENLTKIYFGYDTTKDWEPIPKYINYLKLKYANKKSLNYFIGFYQIKRIKNLSKKVKKINKINKFQYIYQKIESLLPMVLFRMGYIQNLSDFFYGIKKGIFFVNNKKVKTPFKYIKPNSLIHIRIVGKKIENKNFVWFFYRKCFLDCLFKKKYPSHLHIDYYNLMGVFLKYPIYNKKYDKMGKVLYQTYAQILNKMKTF